MEIERKFLIKQIPEGCTSFPCRQIEQAYLNTDPVVRVRRDNDDYYLTYKGKGLLSREEYNLPLNKEAYEHLLAKADGIILTKKRYMIPVPGNDHLTIELDVFEGHYDGLILAEVEFASEEEAKERTLLFPVSITTAACQRVKLISFYNAPAGLPSLRLLCS